MNCHARFGLLLAVLTLVASPLRAQDAAAPPAEEPVTVGIPVNYLIGGGAVVAGLIVLLLVSFFLIVPYMRKGPLRRALAILASNEEGDFPDAEKLLRGVLPVGLGARNLAAARFALAYVLARRRKYSEAAAVFVDLEEAADRRKVPLDGETIYLSLWVQHNLKAHEQVEAIFEEHGDVLDPLLDARLIFGIALLQRANRHWLRREFDKAIAAFDRLGQLDVLTEEIPPHIDNHQVVLGVMALRDRNFDEARACFKGAAETSHGEGQAPHWAELGLLLCDWNGRAEAGWNTEHDDQLRKVLKSLPQASVDGNDAVPAKSADGADPGDDGKEDDESVEKKLDEASLLLRNVHLWHALSLVQTWFHLPAKKGLEPRLRRQFEPRLAPVSRLDPHMPDPYMVAGLLTYFFASDDAERERAVRLLRQARDKGVNLPEVITLLARLEKAERLAQDSLHTFLAFLKKLLGDQGVPPYLRQRLKEYFERNERFKSLGEIDVERGEDDPTGWLGDLRGRYQSVLNGLKRHLQPQLAKADAKHKAEVQALLEGLPKSMSELLALAEKVEEGQAKAVMAAAEVLFPEEEPLDGRSQPKPVAEAMKFSCSQCGKNLRVGREHAGKKVACPGCKNLIDIPKS